MLPAPPEARSPRARAPASTPAPRSCTTTSTSSATPTTVAARYREGWDPVLAERPDALLYPTINGVGDHETRFCHIAPLAESGGLRIGLIDPGSVNLGSLLHLRERRSLHRAPAVAVRAVRAGADDGDLRTRLLAGDALALARGEAPGRCDDPFLLRWRGPRDGRRLLVRPAADPTVARRVPGDARRLPDPVVGGGARR